MSVAERIAEHAMYVSEGNIEQTVDWLRSVGRKVDIYEDDITIHGVNDIRIGLVNNSDPVTSVVQILFALYGVFWVSIEECKQAMNIVNRKWKDRMKEKKKEKNMESSIGVSDDSYEQTSLEDFKL